MNIPEKYSIKDLEQLSGIKAHTLRIWEKRYSLFKPLRTDTNIRYYSNDDLRRILNICLLNKNGIKISRIALMRDAEIAQKVTAINMVRTSDDDVIENLIVAMIDVSEARFDRIFSSCILRMGFETTILKVIFPFFSRIGIMWQTGGINPAQEHFVSNIIRQKIIVAIDSVPINEDAKSQVALLFLPESELHELSLLFYNYALKARKFKTIYLGQTVPTDSLLRIIEITKPDFLISVFTNPISKIGYENFLTLLNHQVKKKRIFISGKVALDKKSRLPSNFILFKDLNGLLKEIL